MVKERIRGSCKRRVTTVPGWLSNIGIIHEGRRKRDRMRQFTAKKFAIFLSSISSFKIRGEFLCFTTFYDLDEIYHRIISLKFLAAIRRRTNVLPERSKWKILQYRIKRPWTKEVGVDIREKSGNIKPIGADVEGLGHIITRSSWVKQMLRTCLAQRG